MYLSSEELHLISITIHHLSAISKGNENPNFSDLHYVINFSQKLLPFYYNIPSYFQSGRTDDMYIFYHKFTRKRVLWL